MEGRVLRWQRYGDTHHTYSSQASAIVYPYSGGYHWEVFVGDSLCWHGQVDALHAAIAHVEDNFVARDLSDSLLLFAEDAPVDGTRRAFKTTSEENR